MGFKELDEAAERHPWRFSLGAGVALGLLFGVLGGSLVGGVLLGAAHVVLQLLGFAWRRKRRERAR